MDCIDDFGLKLETVEVSSVGCSDGSAHGFHSRASGDEARLSTVEISSVGCSDGSESDGSEYDASECDGSDCDGSDCDGSECDGSRSRRRDDGSGVLSRLSVILLAS